MKKLIFTLAIVAVCLSVKAQSKKEPEVKPQPAPTQQSPQVKIPASFHFSLEMPANDYQSLYQTLKFLVNNLGDDVKKGDEKVATTTLDSLLVKPMIKQVQEQIKKFNDTTKVKKTEPVKQ